MNPLTLLLDSHLSRHVVPGFLLVLAIGIPAACFYLGATRSRFFYIGSITVVPFGLAYRYQRQRAMREEMLAQLRASWGRKSERPRDIRACLRASALVPTRTKECRIDQQTWQDLDMDELFPRIDHSLSTLGEWSLYLLLRTLVLDPERLRQRNDLIRRFESDSSFRQEVQEELYRLGRLSFPEGLVELLDRSHHSDTRWIYRALASVPLLALLASSLWTPLVFILAGVWVLNSVIHLRSHLRIGPQVGALRYVGSAISMARRLGQGRISGIMDYQDRLRACADSTRLLAKQAERLSLERLSPPGLEFIYETLNMLFLLEVRAYQSALEEIERHRDQLLELLLLLGELDAFQGVASWRKELGGYAEPGFMEAGSILEIRDAFHPLLSPAVPNSISMRGRGSLICGSNMAGKSTFLRTLGLSAVLAQTICVLPVTMCAPPP